MVGSPVEIRTRLVVHRPDAAEPALLESQIEETLDHVWHLVCAQQAVGCRVLRYAATDGRRRCRRAGPCAIGWVSHEPGKPGVEVWLDPRAM
jgi:hypothetical protein